MSNEQEYLDGRAGRALDVRDRYIDELRAERAQWQAAIAEQPVVAWMRRGRLVGHDFHASSNDPKETWPDNGGAWQPLVYALPSKAEPAPQGVQRLPAHCTAGYCPCVKCPYAGVATEPTKPVQAEAPSDDADPLTPEQEEWVMDLAEKHNLGRRVPQIGALRGVAPDVFYTDASYRTHELFCFAAELLAAKQAGREPVASIYVSPNGEREFDDWGHDLPVGRNELCLATKQAEAPTASNAERSLREALRHAAAVLKSDAGQQTRWATADGVHTLLAALATQQEAQPQAEPVARIEFRRGTPGKENDMPTVVSCNWLPDGVYEVYLADPTGVEPCCGEYAQCHRPCTPRGRWLAQAEPAGGDKEDADWPITWEVSWGELDEDDECSPCGWRVHDRRGSRNDREWELIATGNTPAEAIRAARAAQQTGERDHG